MITLLFADCDETLIGFTAKAGYEAAAGSLARSFNIITQQETICEALMQQYHALHQRDGTVIAEITDMFARLVTHSVLPEEVGWCRFAAFTVVMQRIIGKRAMVGYEFDNIVKAEQAFWHEIAENSAPFDDVLGLMMAADHADAQIQPLTSSDVRVSRDVSRGIGAGRVSYYTGTSAAMKMARIEPALGRFMRVPIVFEAHAERSAAGWAQYMSHFPHVDIANAAIIGDSLGDVEAGVTTGMRVRILIDRDGKYTTCPEPATHLVRSLDEVPAILGWT